MKQYKNVIFDLDGTLLYTLPGLTDSANYALARHGYPPHSEAAVRRMVGNGVRKLMERALPGGKENPAFETAFAAFNEYYALHSNDKTRPYPGIGELLDALRTRGVPTAVATNKNHGVAVPMVASFFGEGIGVTVGKKPGVDPKPAPYAVFEAMAALGAQPEECVYVGDSEVDFQTACNAGLDCLLALWGYRDEPELRTLPAAGFLRAPGELLDYIGDKE